MKRLLTILLLACSIALQAQLQPKDLTEATSIQDADIMIMQDDSDGKVKKFDFSLFKDNILFFNQTGNYVYTLDTLGIGTASPTERIEINGNIKVDTLKGIFQGDNIVATYLDADTIETNVLIATDGDHEAHIGRFSRIDTLNYATANTWVTIKIDTSMVDRTTTGFELTADSLGIKVNFTGIIAITSSAHIHNNGNTATATLYWRTLINGVEASCQNTTKTGSYSGGSVIELNSLYSSNVVNDGDTISFQYRATDADFDIAVYNDGVFDSEIPINVFMMQIVNKK